MLDAPQGYPGFGLVLADFTEESVKQELVPGCVLPRSSAIEMSGRFHMVVVGGRDYSWTRVGNR